MGAPIVLAHDAPFGAEHRAVPQAFGAVAAGKRRVDDDLVAYLPAGAAVAHRRDRPGPVAAGDHRERFGLGHALPEPEVEVVERADHHVDPHLSRARRQEAHVHQAVVTG